MIVLDMSLKPRATTQYQNYDFNSMVRFGGVYLGANGTGLFTLGGNDDDGSKIDAFFEIVTTDLGVSNPKHFRSYSVGFETNKGTIVLEAATDGAAAQVHEIVGSGGQQLKKIPARRDNHGRYWTFTVRNKNGADFGIDSIRAQAIVTTSGRF